MNALELNIIAYKLSKLVPLGTQKSLAIFDSSGRCYDPRKDQSINCLSTYATKSAHFRPLSWSAISLPIITARRIGKQGGDPQAFHSFSSASLGVPIDEPSIDHPRVSGHDVGRVGAEKMQLFLSESSNGNTRGVPKVEVIRWSFDGVRL